jgi:hypothetical protein
LWWRSVQHSAMSTGWRAAGLGDELALNARDHAIVRSGELLDAQVEERRDLPEELREALGAAIHAGVGQGIRLVGDELGIQVGEQCGQIAAHPGFVDGLNDANVVVRYDSSSAMGSWDHREAIGAPCGIASEQAVTDPRPTQRFAAPDPLTALVRSAGAKRECQTPDRLIGGGRVQAPLRLRRSPARSGVESCPLRPLRHLSSVTGRPPETVWEIFAPTFGERSGERSGVWMLTSLERSSTPPRGTIPLDGLLDLES